MSSGNQVQLVKIDVKMVRSFVLFIYGSFCYSMIYFKPHKVLNYQLLSGLFICLESVVVCFHSVLLPKKFLAQYLVRVCSLLYVGISNGPHFLSYRSGELYCKGTNKDKFCIFVLLPCHNGMQKVTACVHNLIELDHYL